MSRVGSSRIPEMSQASDQSPLGQRVGRLHTAPGQKGPEWSLWVTMGTGD
jgi:hypothetical protein